MLNDEDRRRIADAVTAAEEKTSGEITCVLAEEVSNYREVPLGWAALIAFCVPPLLVLAGLHRYAPGLSGWSEGGSGDSLVVTAMASYALLQALLFAGVALLASWPRLRRRLTPGMLRRHRVRQVARHHYAAVGTRLAVEVPHILIFASLKDRRVELVAHQAIHAAVGQAPWDAAVAEVSRAMAAAMQGGGNPTQGFIRAIEICGEALAKHYPASGPDPNHLSNEIVVI